MSNLQKGDICKFQNQFCVVNSSPIYSSAYGGAGDETLAVFYEILSNDGKRTVEASCISGTGVCLTHDLLDNISELVDAVTRVDETETVYYASVRDRREYFSKLCREGYSEEESAYVVEKNTDKYEDRWTAACIELDGVVRKLGLGGSNHSSLVSCYLKQFVV